LPFGGDDQHVVAIAHLDHADDVAVAAAGLDVDDPLPARPCSPVLVQRCALALAALGDVRISAPSWTTSAAMTSSPRRPRSAHAGGGAAHRAHFFFREADDHAELGGDHHLAPAVGAPRGDHRVALVEADRLDAAGARCE